MPGAEVAAVTAAAGAAIAAAAEATAMLKQSTELQAAPLEALRRVAVRKLAISQAEAETAAAVAAAVAEAQADLRPGFDTLAGSLSPVLAVSSDLSEPLPPDDPMAALSWKRGEATAALAKAEAETVGLALGELPEDVWEGAMLRRDQARQDLCHALSLLLVAHQARLTLLDAAAAGLLGSGASAGGATEPTSPVDLELLLAAAAANAGGPDAELWSAAAAIGTRVVAEADGRAEAVRADIEACTQQAAEVETVLQREQRLHWRRARCEELLGQAAEVHGRAKTAKMEERTAKLELDRLRATPDSDSDDSDDGMGDATMGPELAEAHRRHKRRRRQTAELLRERDLAIEEIKRLSLVSDASFRDGAVTVDGTFADLRVRAQRIIKPFKPLQNLNGRKREQFLARQLLLRDNLLVEGRSVKDDYSDEIPEVLFEATRLKTPKVQGKRLRGCRGDGDGGHETTGLKVLKLFSIDEYKQLKRAIVAASLLQHPGVVPVECAFLDGDTVVVQSRFYAGGNLRQWGAGKPAEAKLLSAARLAAAVTFLHQNRIVHRDIKPENIVVDGTDETAPPALCDFDLSLNMAHTVNTAMVGSWRHGRCPRVRPPALPPPPAYSHTYLPHRVDCTSW